MTVHHLHHADRTHVGKVRSSNQDAYRVAGDQGLVAVADGMGGHSAGEIASAMAVKSAIKSLLEVQRADSADKLESLLQVGQAIEKSNHVILDYARTHPDCSGMGTTLVLGMFREGYISYGHVGDSRIYRIRAGRIRRLTRDHSLLQEAVDKGIFSSRSAAQAAGMRSNVLTRGLGLDPHVEVDVHQSLLQTGDIYLFCSDGLTGKVSDDEIALVSRKAEGDLEEMVARLMTTALARGGNDNITLAAVSPQL